MPNPKDYMDDGHQYVSGYVRRKSAEPKVNKFWLVASINNWYKKFIVSISHFKWYWRTLIVCLTYPFVILISIVIVLLEVLLTMLDDLTKRNKKGRRGW